MKRSMWAAAAVIGLGGLVGLSQESTASQDQSSQDFEWRGRIAQGDVIEIKGVNGPIDASFTSGDVVEVRASKIEHRRGNAEDVEIEVVEHSGGVTICAVYPHRNGDRPNTCDIGNRWRSNTHKNDVEVQFEVLIPAGVRFTGKTVNGDVEAKGLRADARVSTVNGDARVETTGLAEASTVNGSVYAVLGDSDWSGELDFSTVNGSVTVEMPAGTSANVKANTVNGSLESDFPLTITGRFANRRMRGTIGSGGGGDLSLSTVNGSIRLRRRG
ncbi:MAG: DUF4097 family beta strand repeat-containing protein [Gemmatimonadota bacterium]